MDLAEWRFLAALNVVLATIRTWIRKGREWIRQLTIQFGKSQRERARVEAKTP
jgi:uncharacterized coiled-coil protein SlyX